MMLVLYVVCFLLYVVYFMFYDKSEFDFNPIQIIIKCIIMRILHTCNLPVRCISSGVCICLRGSEISQLDNREAFHLPAFHDLLFSLLASNY
jgi:hypothetical protein